jgi:hypothetical protein
MEDQEENLKDLEGGQDAKEYPIFPEDGPDSLYSKTDHMEHFSKVLLRLKEEAPELLEMTEENLIDIVKPTPAVRQARITLWEEYSLAKQNRRRMVHSMMHRGTSAKWMAKYVWSENKKLAFLICPPVSYATQLKEAHDLGLKKIREIIASKITDDEGNLLPRSADVVLKAFAVLDIRLKGAVVQKIDQRTIQVTKNLDKVQEKEVLPDDMAELEKLIAEAREQLEHTKRLMAPETIDVTPIEKDDVE